MLDEVPLTSTEEAGYIEAARAAGTLRGYRSDWREFITWNAKQRLGEESVGEFDGAEVVPEDSVEILLGVVEALLTIVVTDTEVVGDVEEVSGIPAVEVTFGSQLGEQITKARADVTCSCSRAPLPRQRLRAQDDFRTQRATPLSTFGAISCHDICCLLLSSGSSDSKRR